MPARHDLLGGKVQLFRRPSSPFWYCSASVAGRQLKASTKADSLAKAKDLAEDWYLTLEGKNKYGDGIPTGRTFKHTADKFVKEYAAITAGERHPDYVKTFEQKLRVHLVPFFGTKRLSEITPGLMQEYRVHRLTPPKEESDADMCPVSDGAAAKSPKKRKWQKPARTTLHHETVIMRQVLKYAHRYGWIGYVPDLAPPYKSSGKIAHRAWFSPYEYKRLWKATQARARKPPHPKWKRECQSLHDYVLFMANTGLRPDESGRLEYRDVAIVLDDATGERILEIEVRGKRGVGFCKSMPGAVRPFERLKERAKPKPTDCIFGKTPRELFNTVLDELELKTDRDGQRRTAYSLRHSYICMRIMEGADIYQVAKNCRTSVEMIEKYYASHIKNTIGASAINVRRLKPGDLTKAAE